MDRNIEKITAIIKNKDQILVIDESSNFRFPEIILDQGDSPRYTLIRYIKDNLGIMIETGHVLDILNYEKDGDNVNHYFFICKIIGGTVKSKDKKVKMIGKEEFEKISKEYEEVIEDLKSEF